MGIAVDDLGDRLSSLLELALEGGLGDGDARDVLGELADRLPDPDLPLPLLPPAVDTLGIPGRFIMPGMPSPYMLASWPVGSMEAMAAIRLELGFLGSRPRALMVMGSIFFGSSPRAESMLGSSFLGSRPMAAASMSVLAFSAAAAAAAALLLSALGDGLGAGLTFLVSSMPIACRVLLSKPIAWSALASSPIAWRDLASIPIACKVLGSMPMD